MRYLLKVITVFSDALNIAVELLSALLLVFLSSLMIIAVFYRYALNDSIYWSAEVSKILLVLVTFLGSTAAYKHSAHIGIDTVVDKLLKRYKKFVVFVIKITFLLFWFLILIESIKLMPMFMIQKTATLEIPYGYVFMVLPISSVIWIVHIISDVAKILKSVE